MLRKLLLSFALFAFAQSIFARCPFDGVAVQAEQWLVEYRGEIGSSPVQLTLAVNGRTLQGRYYYQKYLQDIRVDGSLSEDRTFFLDEYDNNGNKLARITGIFPETDPKHKYQAELGCEVIVGTWSSLAQQRSLPIYLSSIFAVPGTIGNRYPNFAGGEASDEKIESVAKRFLDSLKNDHRKAVASTLHYPFSASINGKRQRLLNSTQVINAYTAIFTDDYKKQFVNVNPKHLGVQHQGFIEMAGSAYIGSDLKIWPTGVDENNPN